MPSSPSPSLDGDGDDGASSVGTSGVRQMAQGAWCACGCMWLCVYEEVLRKGHGIDEANHTMHRRVTYMCIHARTYQQLQLVQRVRGRLEQRQAHKQRGGVIVVVAAAAAMVVGCVGQEGRECLVEPFLLYIICDMGVLTGRWMDRSNQSTVIDSSTYQLHQLTWSTPCSSSPSPGVNGSDTSGGLQG